MIQETLEGVIICLKIFPKSQFNKIVGWKNGKLKIHISATPEKGAANQALISLLSREVGINKAQIHILSGKTSPYKRVLLQGLKAEQLDDLLNSPF